jgi:hypothetical protein
MTPRFRVWNGSEMCYPPHAYLLTGDGKVVEHTDPIDTQHEVMFSTGLTDAEGTEIWEADLVKITYDPPIPEPLLVEWCEYDASFQLDEVHGTECHHIWDPDSLRVIGNVHEHDAALD